jgi:hypothetical protein
MEVDPTIGSSHYVAFRSQFVEPGWLLPGTREYPIGVDGVGDVDSGPLIAGVSLSASVTSMAPARMAKDNRLVTPYRQVGEALGVPITWNGERRYLLGKLPIADAFLVYARTATPWTVSPKTVEAEGLVQWWWRLAWHMITLLPIIGFLYLSIRKSRKKGLKHSLSPDKHLGPRIA